MTRYLPVGDLRTYAPRKRVGNEISSGKTFWKNSSLASKIVSADVEEMVRKPEVNQSLKCAGVLIGERGLN